MIELREPALEAVAGRGVPVPRYDRGALTPRIAHVGVGGFHRAHLAVYAHELAAAGADWGIVGLGLLERDGEMAAALEAQDFLYTLIEKGDGEPTAEVIGSIVDFVHAPEGRDAPLADAVAAPATAILSLTITESGYAEPAPGAAPTTLDRLAIALDARRRRGGGPLTILSCDNLPGNGDVTRRATLLAAERRDGGLAEWVAEQCSFPNSMVDRITPVTAESDRAWLLERLGIRDRWPVVAEPFRQWVMEDDFVADRPEWEQVGILYSDRIHDWEQYKLRMLNAGHSAMAYLSALDGIELVHEAMAVPDVRRFLERLLHSEAVPTLTEIPGHSADDYADSVLERFANSGVRDQIARLCLDGSAKFPTFLTPTVERQLADGGPIEGAATALAGWARYLAVVDPSEQAADPLGDEARRHARAALSDPVAFLAYDAVFSPGVAEAPRFREAFAGAYRRIAEEGPRAAMAHAAEDHA